MLHGGGNDVGESQYYFIRGVGSESQKFYFTGVEKEANTSTTARDI